MENGGGSGQIYDFGCEGDESRLENCKQLSYQFPCGDHSEDVGVVCSNGRLLASCYILLMTIAIPATLYLC